MKNCTCDEAYSSPDGARVRGPTSDVHDCTYVARRNALIPQAEAFARGEVHGSIPAGDSEAYARLFLAEMHRLSVQEGLVSP